MSAIPRPLTTSGKGVADAAELSLQTMTLAWLDAVMSIEQCAYAFPWSRGNFIDSLAAGYAAQLLLRGPNQLLGYFIAMPGVDEMHLLNLTVAPECQGRGHARRLMQALLEQSRKASAQTLWLEVRQNNAHAMTIYRHWGFKHIGLRRGYYPAALSQREDAVVMSLALNEVSSALKDSP